MDRVRCGREREGLFQEESGASERLQRNERESEQKVPREDSSTLARSLAHATMISCQRKEGGRKKDELEKQKRASQNT